MKKLLLPLVFAVIAGVASATAATFVNAKKAATLHAAHVADSLEKHVHDSTAAADSVEKEHKKAESEHADALPLTPADSIRAAHEELTTLSTATKGVPNAADPKHGAAASEHGAAPAAASRAPAAPNGHDVVPPTKGASASKGKVISPRAADSVKPSAESHIPATTAAAHVPDQIESALPEGRIAKIFNGMQAKDAAKILEQMADSDVRVILSKMSDKQAAAILVAFPAIRAAAISRGDSKVAPIKTDSSKTPKPAGDHK